MTSPVRALGSRYALWASRQEPGAIEPGATLGAWVGAAAVIYAVVGANFLIGGFRAEDLTTAFLAPAPPIAWGVVGALLKARGRLAWAPFLACVAVGTGLLVFALTALLLLSVGPATGLFAAIVILAASLHSWVLKSASDAPVAAVALACGMGLAFAFVPRAQSLPLFLLTLGVSTYLSLQIGSWSARAYAEHQQIAAYREALQAQLLAEQVSRTGRLSSTLTDLMAIRHDQRNVAVALALNIDNLEPEVTSLAGREILDDIRGSVEQINNLFIAKTGPLSLRGEHLVGLEPVALGAVAPEVVRLARVRHTAVRFTLAIPPSAPPVLVRGGAPALHRILLNLLLNACEGDGGAERAQSLTVEASMHPGGDVLILEIADDGPGFPAAVLERRVHLATSKEGGSGLGLVTVEGLVTASGGRVSFRNRDGGGAVVTIELATGAP